MFHYDNGIMCVTIMELNYNNRIMFGLWNNARITQLHSIVKYITNGNDIDIIIITGLSTLI